MHHLRATRRADAQQIIDICVVTDLARPVVPFLALRRFALLTPFL